MTLVCVECDRNLGIFVPCVRISIVDPKGSMSNAATSLSKTEYQFTVDEPIKVTGNHTFMCLDCLTKKFPGIQRKLR